MPHSTFSREYKMLKGREKQIVDERIKKIND